ncbi:YggS family pyridoxal phosphate-dependent enzyme [Reichenbachiella agarivorans]|uniref:Pyridoxal phosphate homeostasis protein n=1 Tax=Reichenbachiella agarivorans TaxID=2979464 RepID=A0ABY6CTR6_9BACT|nr:YggS family pyridoxal phosphate-dependent enzyme [Reichenbachiella agarivorans]UXP31635.1 YggS family pyridoxal phosphate-dependent enzyme [Reichenbachiella agarivorans]
MNPEIADNIRYFHQLLKNSPAQLIAVSKTKPNEDLLVAYEAGQRAFGENKVQELVDKYESLPKDIEWHMIGHLQRNKVKYIAPFVHLIHGIDSEKLLREVNKQGEKNDRVINCLLQVHIAQEESKFGFDEEEISVMLDAGILDELQHVKICGLMGMATNTESEMQVSKEFAGLKTLLDQLRLHYQHDRLQLDELSMGMSGDYSLALDHGSTMIRVGSTIFGGRNYGV